MRENGLMRRQQAGMQLFLVELVLAIGFFAMIAAVCVRLFAAAGLTAADSRAKSQAVLAAESAAECFKAAGGDLEKTAAYLGADAGQEDTLILYYDEDWQLQTEPGTYRLKLQRSQEPEGLALADIRVSDGQTETLLFTLQAASAGEVLP